MKGLFFSAHGTPVPQGSKTVAKGGGKVWLRDSNGTKLKAWRKVVTDAVRQQMQPEPLEGPVAVDLTFFLQRPASHFGTGRNAGVLKKSAPPKPSGKVGDLDKLIRAVFDSISNAGAWGDDCQVVTLEAHKVYAGGAGPGVEVYVRSLA